MRTKLFVVLAIILALTTACSDKKEKVRGADDYAIEGTIKNASDKLMLLQTVSPDEVTTVDSVRLDAEGRFAFYGPRPQSPVVCRLCIDDRYVYLCIDSTETVTVEASYTKLEDYKVKGSDNCVKLKELNKKQADLQKRAREIELSDKLFPGQMRDSLLRVIQVYKDDIAQNYLLTAPHTAYAYYALFQTLQHVTGEKMLIYSPYDPADLWAFGSVATSWSVYYPEAPLTKQLETLTITARNELRKRQQPIDESLIVETGLFDIALPDVLGNIRRLTDLKGQVVVLNFNDFHAAESGAIVLALRELYTKYHAQGLEIYQVGVVQDAHWWRQSADKLPWVSVIDETGESARLYNVGTIGEFFVIDRDNVVQQRVNNIADLDKAVAALI